LDQWARDRGFNNFHQAEVLVQTRPEHVIGDDWHTVSSIAELEERAAAIAAAAPNPTGREKEEALHGREQFTDTQQMFEAALRALGEPRTRFAAGSLAEMGEP
jgi:hypothetical protein